MTTWKRFNGPSPTAVRRSREPFPEHSRDAEGDRQQRGRQEERGAGKAPRALWVDERGERLGEQRRAEETRDALQARERALQLPLLARAEVTRHETLQGGAGESPDRHDRHAEDEEPPGGCEAVDGECDHAEA